MPEYCISVNTSGSSGAASGSAQTIIPVRGFVYAVGVAYAAGAPPTTKVVIEEEGGLSQRVLVLHDNNTDTVVYPRVGESGPDNNPLASNVPIYVDGHFLTLKVTDTDALEEAVTAVVQVMQTEAVGRPV